MANRHTGGNAVRINDHVWHYSIDSEGQIFLSEGHPAGTFLSMPGSKFITDLRNSNTPDFHLHELVASVVLRNDHSIYDSFLSSSRFQRNLLILLPLLFTLQKGSFCNFI